MDARLVLERTESAESAPIGSGNATRFAADLYRHVPISAMIVLVGVNDLPTPTLAFAILPVHTEQYGREVLGIIATGAAVPCMSSVEEAEFEKRIVSALLGGQPALGVLDFKLHLLIGRRPLNRCGLGLYLNLLGALTKLRLGQVAALGQFL